MTDAAALLAAIRAAPDDDAPRLVYADWLDEHGHPERAEFIRLQVQLARYEQLHSHTGEEIVGLWLREDELLARHSEAIGGLATPRYQLDFERGFATGFSYLAALASRQPDRAGLWTYLLFGPGAVVRRMETTHAAGDLVERARSYLATNDPDWGDGRCARTAPEEILDWAWPRFFQQLGGAISDTRYVLNPFGYPLTVSVDGTEYWLTSDRVRLHLDSAEGPPWSDPSLPGFDSLPET
jgi:uncharacterized protein (TIGR02996 family)